MRLTDARTFITGSVPPSALRDDTAARQIVRGEPHPHAVADENADEILPDVAGQVRRHTTTRLQFDPIQRLRQQLEHGSLDFHRLAHAPPSSSPGRCPRPLSAPGTNLLV